MKEPVENKEAKQQEDVVLNDKQIQAWKKQWGKIYKTTIGDEVFIWRKLKRKEYVQIMSEAETDEAEEQLGSRIYQRQEKITKLVVLYPADIDQRVEEDAGLATSISDEVILKSGFDVATTEEL